MTSEEFLDLATPCYFLLKFVCFVVKHVCGFLRDSHNFESTVHILTMNSMDASNNTTEVTCAYFLQRKKRYCRMSVKAGRKFCGEHASLDAATQVCPTTAAKYARTPCPYDPNQ